MIILNSFSFYVILSLMARLKVFKINVMKLNILNKSLKNKWN